MSARVKLLVPIDAPFDDVVGKLSGFDALAALHPAFSDCLVEGEGEGALRTLRMGSWTVRDRLDELSEGRGYRYTQLEGPLAARQHRGYLWVRRRKNGLAVVEWAAKLKGSELPEPLAKQLLEAIFRTGLAAAKLALER